MTAFMVPSSANMFWFRNLAMLFQLAAKEGKKLR